MLIKISGYLNPSLTDGKYIGMLINAVKLRNDLLS